MIKLNPIKSIFGGQINLIQYSLVDLIDFSIILPTPKNTRKTFITKESQINEKEICSWSS